MEATVVLQLESSAVNPGPIDGSVLYDQDKHVSSAVWDGQERGALRCHEHTSKLDQWKLTSRQIKLVEKAGFGHLRLIPAISLDNPLISALVERWRRETNTFHLNAGEMTVTLKDVALLLGLSIDGEPVIGITYTSCNSVCEKFLGKAPELGYASGGMVKLSWLKEFFSECPEDGSLEEVERYTRAYLLYLVGSTIFSTTTGNKVPVMYLPLFGDFEHCGRYAWGAAALAFLYRALGNASLASQSTISGCLTLLQCWSYYHLNIGRPKLKHEPAHDSFPYVLRWKGKQLGPTANRDVVYYRKVLDALKPCDIEWLPYKHLDSTVIPEDIRNTLNLGRSKTMLICFDKAERHLPGRCLRQCGMVQHIPDDVQPWQRKNRGVDGGVDLSAKMELELKEWQNRHLSIVEGDENVDEDEYMQWYFSITRKFVGRPISLSTEFQRTNSGLRDIAHIADTFPTEGLDPQQVDSISRIRYIAHECLRGQVDSPGVSAGIQMIEFGKRSRGKEKVRRRSFGKRKHKDEPMDCDEINEDGRSHFHGAIIKVDDLSIDNTDLDGTHHLCGLDNEDPSELCVMAVDGENIPLCTDPGNGELSMQQHCGIGGTGSNTMEHLYDASQVNASQLGYMPNGIHVGQACDEMKEMHGSQYLNSMEDEVVDESQLSHVTNESNPQQTAVIQV
ncbi:hypothetical protein SAY86_010373 [Trapa natans]|uniref:Aminotransferase-like plant mobile domain-containing protein n=1 Tax=Trapa natans TaxID=22666 RepID=A0AAN7LJH0_TRANT|nr:hypothetical protein SAY86_010373 [Trapa natans]